MTPLCVLCGHPVQAHEPSAPVFRDVVHVECQQRDGRSARDLMDALPCCTGRSILTALGGYMVLAQEGIPTDELWFMDRDSRRVDRFRLLPKGPITLEELPPLELQRRPREVPDAQA